MAPFASLSFSGNWLAARAPRRICLVKLGRVRCRARLTFGCGFKIHTLYQPPKKWTTVYVGSRPATRSDDNRREIVLRNLDDFISKLRQLLGQRCLASHRRHACWCALPANSVTINRSSKSKASSIVLARSRVTAASNVA